MIGIPDAVTLHLISPFEDAPCRNEEVVFDLSNCTPSWSANFDFFFTLLKVINNYRQLRTNIPLIKLQQI